jgi:hypothetical protein
VEPVRCAAGRCTGASDGRSYGRKIPDHHNCIGWIRNDPWIGPTVNVGPGGGRLLSLGHHIGGVRALITSDRDGILALVSVREALMQVRGGQNVLESLPDEEFQRLGRDLPGAILNRDEVVFVEPDPDYFTKLAAARGDGADRAFFSAFKATYPESVWPLYVEPQTDYGGCTRFGSMTLVETYRTWFDFQRTFRGRYAASAQRETDAVIEQLTTSTCACGDLASVERELQRFRRRFPTSPARAKIDQRLQALRARRSEIRTSCVAG